MIGQTCHVPQWHCTKPAGHSASGPSTSNRLPVPCPLFRKIAQPSHLTRGQCICQAESSKQQQRPEQAPREQQPSELSFPAQDDMGNTVMQSAGRSASSLPHKQGDMLDGRYQVLSVRSQTGSTTVYIAKGPDGKKVSIKALSLQSMANWDELEQFERESRALRAISSSQPAIPTLVEVFEENDEDRTFYLAQELVEGPTMAQQLAQGWKASPATLQRLSTQLLQGLQAMSQAAGGPIAHNAITPDNIILRQTPEGLQACLTNFSAAEQVPMEGESTPALPQEQPPVNDTIMADRIASHHAASSSSWDVEVEMGSEPMPQQVSAASAADAQLVTAPLSEALATSVEYAAPEALAGEARMGMSDAYSVGAVLAAAASGSAPSSGRWTVPGNLEGTRLAAVIQRLLQSDWRCRLTVDQALRVLAGQPMPAMPASQPVPMSGKGVQGLAQRVLQFGRDARARTDAALSQRKQPTPGAEGQQAQGSLVPAAVLGLAAATLFLGPAAPLFLFSFLPLLSGSSRQPRYALASGSSPLPMRMGFQGVPRQAVSPMQQQQMLRMMLAQQAQQQRLQAARYMQWQRHLQLQRRRQMWGGFY